MPQGLAPLVQEGANNPGVGTTVTLSGVVELGYVTFASQFAPGDKVFYYITDGTLTECQEGSFTAGPPSSLSRGTPIWTSNGPRNGPYSRIDFPGSVKVYCSHPADRILYGIGIANAIVWDARSRRLGNLADAVDLADALSRRQVGWERLNNTLIGAPVSVIDINLPSPFTRFRLEWEISPVSGQEGFLFARFWDASVNRWRGEDGETIYGWSETFADGTLVFDASGLTTPQSFRVPGGGSNHVRLSRRTSGPTTGFAEFSRGPGGSFGVTLSSAFNNSVHGHSMGNLYVPWSPTWIRFAMFGTQAVDIQTGRVRLLGALAA